MKHYHISLIITLVEVLLVVGSFMYILVYPRKNINEN
jgi:hypothetical protein